MSSASAPNYPRVAKLRSAEQFEAHLKELGVAMPFDAQLQSGSESPLGQPLVVAGRAVGNRFCILPMEGWDGQPDGRPSDLTQRRWKNFGASGAKLIWGGEAVAVVPEGRANPNQVWLNDGSHQAIGELRMLLV